MVNIGTIWSSEGETVRSFCRLRYTRQHGISLGQLAFVFVSPTPAVEYLCGLCDLSADRLKAGAFAS